ncbi:MAG: UDP-2,3-diacylglucosamine diphosphatase [Pseudomonadota bacterium]
MMPAYRSLWISDVHLGTRACRAADLLSCLDTVRAERIYLVGDIFDLERIKTRPNFPEAHQRVVYRLIELAAEGTDILYIPGNHDFEFRRAVGQRLLGIPIVLEAVHITPGGKRMLVTHGDILDGRIREGTNLQSFGATAYRLLMEIDVLINRLRQSLGRDAFSICASLKRHLASANEYIRRFETVAADYARERGFDGIVCGHIHRPRVRMIGNCLYANDGDWVEHGTALAERADGNLDMLEVHSGKLRIQQVQAESTVQAAA